MTPMKNELRTLLEKVKNGGLPPSESAGLEAFDVLTVDQAETTILDLIRSKVIGEDEEVGFSVTLENTITEERNGLRAEQRAILDGEQFEKAIGGDA